MTIIEINVHLTKYMKMLCVQNLGWEDRDSDTHKWKISRAQPVAVFLSPSVTKGVACQR